MIDWFKHVVFDNYANFEGRARRSEFWWFHLASTLISIVLSLIGGLLFGDVLRIGVDTGTGLNGNDPLSSLYSVAVLVPTLAVGARRLHDTGRSGWWQLLIFTCIGVIPLIVFWAMEGDRGPNQYGPDPKGLLEDNLTDHLVD